MWHHAQSSELPTVEIKWKLFLLTRPPVSDSDASGWVVVPTAPSGLGLLGGLSSGASRRSRDGLPPKCALEAILPNTRLAQL